MFGNRKRLSRKIIRPDDPGYFQALLATAFNKKVPAYGPNVIVQPQSAADIVDAIALAKRENLRVSICSGGSSWSTNHIREGGLLINMANFFRYEIDKSAMTAKVGPACKGDVLLKALVRRGLFFPAGHCKGVCMGGYLLQGGFGWNSHEVGLACESVIGLDIVTADGKIVHASETQNQDLYWAARGAGSGFFGVVIQFHLRLFPKPKHMGVAIQVFDLAQLENVFHWAYEISPEVPNQVEFQIYICPKTLLSRKPGIEVSAVVMSDRFAKARKSLAFLTQSAIKKRARLKVPYLPTTIGLLYAAGTSKFSKNHRWDVDNIWTKASADQLLPYLPELIKTMPPHKSHIMWMKWNPTQRPDMAFSVEDQYYFALFGTWKDARDDSNYGNWATNGIRNLEHLSTGIQLADENLHKRVDTFASETNMQKLDAIRAKWDPELRFYPWHNRSV